jgi:Glycerate kinase family
MKLIRNSDDHRFDLRVSKHFLVSAIGHFWFPDLRHPVSQVIRGVANGIQPCVSGFLAALEMSGLRDHPTSKNTNSNRLRSRFHILSNFDLFVFIQGWQRRQSRKLDRLEKVIPPSDPSWISGRVVAAVDVFNPLLGKRGATRVYGPQKGLAGETEIRVLEAALTRLADVVADWRKNDLRDRPGAGAAGGLGFGLMAFCGAEVHRGFDQVAELLRLLRNCCVLARASLRRAGIPR